MHSAINIQISLNYYPPRKGKRTHWEANPQRYFDLFEGRPERIRNLHFAFVVLLRALKKASGALKEFPISVGDEKSDVQTHMLMQRLLDTHILKSCGPLFTAFDESKLFQEGNGPAAATELKYQFKGVFRNVTKILDCVTCQKCKLHGKLAIKGLGTALTILLLPEHLIQKSLTREDVVSLVNTVTKFSDAIINYKKLVSLASDMQTQKLDDLKRETKAKTDQIAKDKSTLKDAKAFVTDEIAFDIILGMVSKLALMGKLSHAQEDKLVDATIAKDSRLISLIKHYAVDPERFVQHALRILSNGNIDNTILSEKGKKTQPNAIIIGSGLSGLTAALTLVDRGAKVVIIEKQPFMGGNSAYASSGINAARQTSDESVTEDLDNANKFAEDAFKSSEMKDNLGHPSHTLIPVLTSRSFDALEWARNRVSVDLSKVGQLGGHSYPRTFRPATGMAGSELIFAISKIIKSFPGNKVDLRMKTSAKEILVDATGKAIGVKVRVEGKDEDEDIFADNVIIATGGFANDRTNTSLLSKYTPELTQFATTNGKFATGDGHKMSIQAGASVVDMENVQVHPTAFIDLQFPDASRKTLCAEILRGLGGILLNTKGERFVDELGTRKHIVETMQSQENNEKLQFTILLSPEMAAQADKHVPHYYKKGLLKKFETLEEVAAWMKVDLNTLENTLDVYNEASVSGNDAFGKKHFKNTPIPKSRGDSKEYFYGGLVTPALHYCMGGISIDGSGHVLKNDGSIFNGLYAAGEATGGLHGVNRLGGNALTECIVFGRVVGEVIEIKEEDLVSEPELSSVEASDNNLGTKKKLISKEELAKHNSAEDCWVSIGNQVYDLTDFLEEHPSGPQPILDLAGKDGTEEFDAVHTRGMLDDFDIVGELV